MALAPQLVGRVGCVVDLSAAFRLKDAALYPRWYGFDHDQPELLAEAVYGLPERHRAELKGARLVATPGCYVTAATLALAPLLDAGLIEPAGLIVDAASGVSGAGRAATPTNAFCTVDENFVAYGLLDHRHTPEIEQNLGAQVLFTPHLAPMNRGILATCYARPGRRCGGLHGVAARRAAPGVRRRAVRRRHRRLAVDEGDARLEHRPRHGPLRRAHRLRRRAVRPRQPDEGRLRRRPAVGQRRPRPRRDGRTPARRPRAVTASEGARRARGWHSDGRNTRMGSGERGRATGRPRPRRGAAVHPALRRQDDGRQVRRQRARRHVGPRRPRPVRRGHRADAPRRHAPGRRPRRRPADQRPDEPPRQDHRVPRRAAGHRRRDRRHRPHGADRPGQPAARHGHQPPRQLRRRRQRRGRRADPGRAARPRAGLRRRRRRRSTRRSSRACWPTSSSRSSPRSAPTSGARRTTSTPTSSPAPSPRRSAPRSSSTSPTSRACAATSTTRPA